MNPSNPGENSGRLTPYQLAEEHLQLTQKTAIKVSQIEENVRQEHAAASRRMFDKRNEANREWQQLDEQGKQNRYMASLETAIAIQGIEDLSEENMKAQLAEFAAYEKELERKKQAEEERSLKTLSEMGLNLNNELTKLDQRREADLLQSQNFLENENSKIKKEIEVNHNKERLNREQEQAKLDEDLKQIQERSRREIEEINRRTEMECKKKSKSLKERFTPSFFGGSQSHDSLNQTGSSFSGSQQNRNMRKYDEDNLGLD